jgi:hypothetical protein
VPERFDLPSIGSRGPGAGRALAQMKTPTRESGRHGMSGGLGRNRTTDTRIFNIRGGARLKLHGPALSLLVQEGRCSRGVQSFNAPQLHHHLGHCGASAGQSRRASQHRCHSALHRRQRWNEAPCGGVGLGTKSQPNPLATWGNKTS